MTKHSFKDQEEIEPLTPLSPEIGVNIREKSRIPRVIYAREPIALPVLIRTMGMKPTEFADLFGQNLVDLNEDMLIKSTHIRWRKSQGWLFVTRSQKCIGNKNLSPAFRADHLDRMYANIFEAGEGIYIRPIKSVPIRAVVRTFDKSTRQVFEFIHQRRFKMVDDNTIHPVHFTCLPNRGWSIRPAKPKDPNVSRPVWYQNSAGEAFDKSINGPLGYGEAR